MKHHCLRCPAIFGSSEPGWSHTESPCKCDCEPCKDFKRSLDLPPLSSEELDMVEKLADNSTPGPWKAAQLQGFGPMSFLLTESKDPQTQWLQIVAKLENAGL